MIHRTVFFTIILRACSFIRSDRSDRLKNCSFIRSDWLVRSDRIKEQALTHRFVEPCNTTAMTLTRLGLLFS